jgi:hypothetical protein
VQEPIFVGGLPAEGWLANVRELDGKVLGIVSSRYRVLQNRDAFAFASDLIDTGGAVIETAGLLRGGRWSWFLLRLPDEVMIGGDRDERLVTYLLIANSFDGTMSVTVAIVTVRVVCSNTLSLALDTAQRAFRVQHTGSLEGRLAEARRALEISFRYREELRTVGEELLARPVSDAEFERFLAEPMPWSSLCIDGGSSTASRIRGIPTGRCGGFGRIGSAGSTIGRSIGRRGGSVPACLSISSQLASGRRTAAAVRRRAVSPKEPTVLEVWHTRKGRYDVLQRGG